MPELQGEAMSRSFWALRCKTLELVKFSILDIDKVRGPSDFHVIPCEVFQHIFGTVPAPGTAMLISPSCWIPHCDKCGVELRHKKGRYITCHECGHHHDRCDSAVVYHARILKVKSLEENS
jgi:hypothetical protein